MVHIKKKKKQKTKIITIAVTAPLRSQTSSIRGRGGFHEIVGYFKSKCVMQRPRKAVWY